MIGEFPDTPDAASRWQKLYANGYAGGWNWSLSPEHTADKLGTDTGAASDFARGKPNLGPSLGAGVAPGASGPGFVLGFASLRGALGDVMGTPTENEYGIQSSCDTQQLTTTGLAYWRCATNTITFAAFPDGMHHWALINGQLVDWVGPSPDPPTT